jgi:hypothetical protein
VNSPKYGTWSKESLRGVNMPKEATYFVDVRARRTSVVESLSSVSHSKKILAATDLKMTAMWKDF